MSCVFASLGLFENRVVGVCRERGFQTDPPAMDRAGGGPDVAASPPTRVTSACSSTGEFRALQVNFRNKL